MTRSRTSLLAVLAAAACAWAGRADASVQLGLGADYWFEPDEGMFQLTLAVDTPLARNVTVGGRFGALVTSGPNDVAVPLDLRLRFRMQATYLELLGGPWIFFQGDQAVRGHGAIGFGLVRGSVSFGVEAGYLHPSAVAGVRLAFRL
jgi:hypothetical protein